MKEFPTRGGEIVNQSAQRMLDEANDTQKPMFMIANDVRLEAYPGYTLSQVTAPYDAKLAEWAAAAAKKEAARLVERAEKLKTVELKTEPPPGFVPDLRGRWGVGLILLTPAQMKLLPVGQVVYSIMGNEVVVGVDYIDDDTRGGFTAYGIRL